MKKFTFGVFFDSKLTVGGSFQQSLNNIILSNNLTSNEIDVKVITTIPENIEIVKKYGIKGFLYSPNILIKFWLNILNILPYKIYKVVRFFKKKNNFEEFLDKLNVDLIYFVSQSSYVDHLHSINYIYTVFDLAHRDFPEFPEVSSYKIFDSRETRLQKNLQRAIAIISESDYGKKNLISRYNLIEERVYVFPLDSGKVFYEVKKENYLPKDKKNSDIKQRYNLKCDYVFYPSQFWAHKNHIYILKALEILKNEEKINLGAVFSGSDMGNLSYIKSMTKKMRLEDRVRFVGFVPNEELPFLYAQSVALVMPTYFGPTNIPPLEAFKLNIPVLYSDLPGLKEQVGSAALLLDLKDPRCLVKNIKRLLKSEDLRNELIEQGKLIINELKSKNNNLDTLKKILNNFRVIRDCWNKVI